jgi:hypothetical protein
MILTYKHKIPRTDEEPQANARNAYVGATPLTHSPPDGGISEIEVEVGIQFEKIFFRFS